MAQDPPGVKAEGDLGAVVGMVPQGSQGKHLVGDRVTGGVHSVIPGVNQGQGNFVPLGRRQRFGLKVAGPRPAGIPFGRPPQFVDGLAPAPQVACRRAGGPVEILEVGQGRHPIDENPRRSGFGKGRRGRRRQGQCHQDGDQDQADVHGDSISREAKFKGDIRSLYSHLSAMAPEASRPRP